MFCEPVLSQSTAAMAQLRCLVGERHLRARRTEFASWVGHSLAQHEVERAHLFPEQIDQGEPHAGWNRFRARLERRSKELSRNSLGRSRNACGASLRQLPLPSHSIGPAPLETPPIARAPGRTRRVLDPPDTQWRWLGFPSIIGNVERRPARAPLPRREAVLRQGRRARSDPSCLLHRPGWRQRIGN
jgi:hypothetical protein